MQGLTPAQFSQLFVSYLRCVQVEEGIVANVIEKNIDFRYEAWKRCDSERWPNSPWKPEGRAVFRIGKLQGIPTGHRVIWRAAKSASLGTDKTAAGIHRRDC